MPASDYKQNSFQAYYQSKRKRYTDNNVSECLPSYAWEDSLITNYEKTLKNWTLLTLRTRYPPPPPPTKKVTIKKVKNQTSECEKILRFDQNLGSFPGEIWNKQGNLLRRLILNDPRTNKPSCPITRIFFFLLF